MKTKILFENWRRHLSEQEETLQEGEFGHYDVAEELGISPDEVLNMHPDELEFAGYPKVAAQVRRMAAEREASRERLALRQRRAAAQKAGRSEPQDGVRDPLNPLETAPVGSGVDATLADYKVQRVQRAIEKKKSAKKAAREKEAQLLKFRAAAEKRLKEQEESYRMVKDPISGKRRMMRSDELGDAMAQVDDELPLTAAFPWMQSVIDDLKDDEFPDKEKAIQALAKQLGMSIKTMPSDMDEEPTMSEVKTISKKKFETTLENLVFEELARVFMEQESKGNNYAGLLKKELMSQIRISDDTASRILKDKAIAMSMGTLSMAIDILSKGRKQDPNILANKAIPAVVKDAFTLFKNYKKKSPKDADGRALVNFLDLRLQRLAKNLLDKADQLKPKPKPKVTRKLTQGEVPDHTREVKIEGGEVIVTLKTKDGLVAQGRSKIRGKNVGFAKQTAYSRAQTALVQKSQERRTAGAD
tara:strand:- start:2919 stop:4337 length:1419 start_codon:yes stop_codon:yes gene_type:complete